MISSKRTATKFSIELVEPECQAVAAMLKELSHPLRLMILSHLLDGSKNVSDLVNLCKTSQSQISQFLTRMRLAGLIKAEKRGKFQMYSVADERLFHLMQTIQNEYCNLKNHKRKKVK